MIRNAMTIDVEDYFHVSAFENHISKSDWSHLPLRVEKSTDRLLELFDAKNVHATFFVLGWVADKCPGLVKRIGAQGHEVASHGYSHGRATEQTREVFRDDVKRSRELLEDLCGQPVLGYRAPSFSVNKSNEWVFDELLELGFVYSSSTYPVKHDLYGVPDWPRFKYQRNNGLIEVPLTTLKTGSRNLPIAGGGYFRLYPYFLTRYFYRKFHQVEKKPGIFYMHPWEIDVDQPRQQGVSFKSSFRHYLNIGRHLPRLTRMLDDFSWGRMDEVFGLNLTGSSS
ncbi:MAG: polysaccharide deacetylase family protein [Proteobacteria bacterium]|nr:MAG: polysaccharide deacetylase family protein [Pseudomonadota bacterium]